MVNNNFVNQIDNLMTDLHPLGLLKVSGEGAKKLLQGQLTCDLDEISSTQTRLGAHCNPQGRIISLFRLFWYKDAYYLQMPQELLTIAANALKKYAIFFKAQLEISDSLFQMGLCGNQFSAVLPSLPTLVDEASLINDLLIYKIPGKLNRYEITGNKSDLTELFNTLKTNHTTISTANYWKNGNILAGIPAIYPETSEKFLPHELDLPTLNAVSFKKGCYTGQEIIARMQYRGKLKNHLYHAKVHTLQEIERGQDIFKGVDRCGSIVDFCKINDNEYDLLVIASQNDVTSTPISLKSETQDILNF